MITGTAEPVQILRSVLGSRRSEAVSLLTSGPSAILESLGQLLSCLRFFCSRPVSYLRFFFDERQTWVNAERPPKGEFVRAGKPSGQSKISSEYAFEGPPGGCKGCCGQ